MPSLICAGELNSEKIGIVRECAIKSRMFSTISLLPRNT
jgi:hypothetical protein